MRISTNEENVPVTDFSNQLVDYEYLIAVMTLLLCNIHVVYSCIHGCKPLPGV